jgi:phosphohistidine phosphatase SixA
MVLYLVRHAEADNKRAGAGPDSQRPLTDAGWRQAHGLVAQLDGQPITDIVSSPTVRCVQTVEPLARQRALDLQTDSRLHVDGDAARALKLLLEISDAHPLWCTHGELISQVLTRLRDRGAPIGDAPQWAKGSVWRLEVVDGAVVGAIYQPPAS